MRMASATALAAVMLLRRTSFAFSETLRPLEGPPGPDMNDGAAAAAGVAWTIGAVTMLATGSREQRDGVGKRLDVLGKRALSARCVRIAGVEARMA